VAYPDTLIRVRTDSHHIDPRYLRLIWDSGPMRAQIEASARTTAGIHKINQQSLLSYVVPIPPLPEQVRITAEAERRLSVVDEQERQIEASLKRAERLRQAILKRAFQGRLVPQDPSDEPASMLLERIRAARAAPQPATRRQRVQPGRKRCMSKAE